MIDLNRITRPLALLDHKQNSLAHTDASGQFRHELRTLACAASPRLGITILYAHLCEQQHFAVLRRITLSDKLCTATQDCFASLHTYKSAQHRDSFNRMRQAFHSVFCNTRSILMRRLRGTCDVQLRLALHLLQFQISVEPTRKQLLSLFY